MIYHKGEYDNLLEDDFSWSKNIVFIVYIVIIFLNTFQCGMLQHLEYVYYQFNTEDFNIIEANAVAQNEYGADSLRFVDILEWKHTILNYKIEGIDYSIGVYSYPELVEQQQVAIAVKKNNPKKIIRCIPYVMTMDDELNCIFGWGSVIIIFCYLFIIKCLIVKRKKKRQIYYAEKVKVTEINETQYTHDELLLQKIILDKYNLKNKDNSSKIEWAKQLLEVEFHRDFLWCLQYLTDEHLENILFVKCEEEKYAFVDETLAMREYGLPMNYYIIAKSGEHYLCGQAYSSRLFLFSKNLGITNTQYENIYNYLIEHLEPQ